MTPDTIQKLAKLAKLALSEQEVNGLATDLGKIFELIDTMNQTNTDNIAPLAHPTDAHQRLRADNVTEQDQSEQFLALAPQTAQGLFIVPEVIE